FDAPNALLTAQEPAEDVGELVEGEGHDGGAEGEVDSFDAQGKRADEEREERGRARPRGHAQPRAPARVDVEDGRRVGADPGEHGITEIGPPPVAGEEVVPDRVSGPDGRIRESN